MATNVTKFFRKYNKTMLAVFTIFLMVAFLLPATLKELFQSAPGTRVVAEAFGKKIRIGDLTQIEQELGILNILNQVIYSSGNAQNARPFNIGAFLQFSPQNEQTRNYYLLVKEAHNAGIRVSAEQVDRVLDERSVPAEIINSILRNQQISLDGFRQAIADYLAVEGYFEMAASSVKISDPELQHMFKLMYNRMTAQILPVPASDFVKQVSQPSDKDLALYFDSHRNEFAYPDRVQVEYIKADVDATKDNIKINRDRVRQTWEEHRSEYTTTTQPATQKGKTSTAPASQQAPIQVEMPMEQALPKVAEKMKFDKAHDIVQQAISSIKQRSMDEWRNSPLDKSTGARQKVSDYQKLVEQATNQFKDAKVSYHRTPLISAEEAAQLPGIGSAFLPGQQPIPFAAFAFHVKPLVQPTTKKEQETVLEPYQDSPWLLRQMGENGKDSALYLFRVIKVSPNHMPASLDEVKAKVAETYRLNQAFTIAQQNAQKICQNTGKQTLADVVKKPGSDLAKIFKQLDTKKIESETFSRRQFSYGGQLSPPMLNNVRGDTAQFADQAFAKLWSGPTTQPSGVRSCATIDDAKTRTAYAVQIEDKKPALENEYTQFKGFLARFAMMSQQQDFIRSWFNPVNIHKRTGYVSKTQEDESL